MEATRQNLFSSLSRWATGQSENFLSESFARVLEALRDETPSVFSKLVVSLTSGAIHVNTETCDEVTVDTQVQADSSNYPDIQILGPEFLIWIEVKDYSPMNPDQLERYSNLLSERDIGSKSLVFLSRAIAPLPNLELLSKPISWTNIGEWLDEIDWQSINPASSIARYLTYEFRDFLKDKNMTIERVGWELTPGIQSLVGLRLMMRETIQTTVSGKIWAAGGHGFTGWGIFANDGKTTSSYLLIYFEKPDELKLIVREDYLPESEQETWEPHSRGWYGSILNLVDEESHFFSRQVSSQKRLIHEFIEEKLAGTNVHLRSEGEDVAEVEIGRNEDQETDQL